METKLDEAESGREEQTLDFFLESSLAVGVFHLQIAKTQLKVT